MAKVLIDVILSGALCVMRELLVCLGDIVNGVHSM